MKRISLILSLAICLFSYIEITAQCDVLLNGSSANPAFVCSSDLPLPLSSSSPGGSFNPTPGVIESPTGVFVFSPISTGSFVVVYTTADGSSVCNLNIIVDDVDQQAEIITPASPFICENAAPIELEGNINDPDNTFFSVNISNIVTEFDPAQWGAGVHELGYFYIDPANGCTSSDILSINVLAIPDLSINGLQDSYCLNDPPSALSCVELSAGQCNIQGPGVVGLNTFDPSLAGVGTHEILSIYEDFSGCTDTLVLTTEVIDVTNIAFEQIDTVCAGEKITLFYSGDPLPADAVYFWTVENGNISLDGGNFIDVYWDVPGSYEVQLEVANIACPPSEAFISSVFIGGVETTTIDDVVITEGEEVELTTSSSESAGDELVFQWSPTSGLSCTDCDSPIATPTQTTTYTVFATNTSGCTASDTVLVSVLSNRSVFIPNIFTPNDDGNNDVLILNGQGIATVNALIYNRWGGIIYQSNDVTNLWDGTHNGTKVNSGVYLYTAEITFFDGEVEVFTGDVTVIR